MNAQHLSECFLISRNYCLLHPIKVKCIKFCYQNDIFSNILFIFLRFWPLTIETKMANRYWYLKTKGNYYWLTFIFKMFLRLSLLFWMVSQKSLNFKIIYMRIGEMAQWLRVLTAQQWRLDFAFLFLGFQFLWTKERESLRLASCQHIWKSWAIHSQKDSISKY